VRFSSLAIALLIVFAAFIVIAHRTVFGRNVYGVGGDEQAARLMGIRIGRTKILVYALGGLCSAAAGIAASIYKGSGDPGSFTGAELDVITAVVIGGTLLRGGSGYVAGTFCGVIIIGAIQSIINFQGTLAGAWPRIIIGSLLLIAILLQQLLAKLARSRG
jgi:simple sugar transport system permease protein